jgi:hypothetical protein
VPTVVLLNAGNRAGNKEDITMNSPNSKNWTGQWSSVAAAIACGLLAGSAVADIESSGGGDANARSSVQAGLTTGPESSATMKASGSSSAQARAGAKAGETDADAETETVTEAETSASVDGSGFLPLANDAAATGEAAAESAVDAGAKLGGELLDSAERNIEASGQAASGIAGDATAEVADLDAIDGAVESAVSGEIAAAVDASVQNDIRDAVQAGLVTDITRSLPLPGND